MSLKESDTTRRDAAVFIPRRGSPPSDTIMLRKNLSLREMKGIFVSKFDSIFYDILIKKQTKTK
tara:strand:- start:39 stop:230 length:192 start_codon:yes stop_codon:yes gene_type:complete